VRIRRRSMNPTLSTALTFPQREAMYRRSWHAIDHNRPTRD